IMTDVLVVAELLEGKARKASLSAVAFAKQVAGGTGGAFDILAIGEGAEAAAKELVGFGARKVLVAEIGGGYICERFAPTVAATGKNYGVVVATATTFAQDLLPRVAAKLNAGIAPDIAAVKIEGGKPVYRRPMFAGNVIGTVQIESATHVVSVRPAEFDAASPSR